MAFAPLLFADTAPVKSFVAVVSVMTPAPPLKVDVPPTVSPPAFCVIPTAFTVRLFGGVIKLQRQVAKVCQRGEGWYGSSGIGIAQTEVAHVGQRTAKTDRPTEVI